MKLPEQKLWSYLDRTMRAVWKAQRVENRVAPDTPDVTYSCRQVNGYIELKVVSRWPIGAFDIGKLTSGQRSWLTRHGNAGGHAFVLAKVEHDYLLVRYDQIDKLGVWKRREWEQNGWGFWRERIDADTLAHRLTD